MRLGESRRMPFISGARQPFEISEEDFRKTAMDYLMYKKGIDAKAFSGQLFDRIMYSADD